VMKIISELSLENPVHPADFLFLTQLNPVLGNPRSPGLAVLPRRIIPFFQRTFLRETFRPLEKQLLLLSTAQLAIGINVSCHKSPDKFSFRDRSLSTGKLQCRN
jgi:hypothetical protein